MSMSEKKRLTTFDQKILECIEKEESLKRGLELASKELGVNYFKVKNRWYNHILCLFQDKEPIESESSDTVVGSFEGIDYIKAKAALKGETQGSHILEFRQNIINAVTHMMDTTIEWKKEKEEIERLKKLLDDNNIDY